MSLAESSPYFSQMAGGDYLQIIATAVDSRDAKLNPEDIPWVIGALTLVGRNMEADGILQRWMPRLTKAQMIIVRCFLGSALCREGRQDGEVVHNVEDCSGLMRKLIKWLAKGESAKERLASSLWGRSYDPARHDKQIYGLVAKTRHFPGAYGKWIEVSESGYRLRLQIRVLTQYLRMPQPISLLQSDGSEQEALPALNIHQATVLSWMRAGEIIEPKAICDRLKVSDATASRDLAKLLELGLAYRMGKGRTTRYAYGTS